MDVGSVSGITSGTDLYNSVNKASDDSFEKQLKSAMDNGDEKELKKACQEFESVMLNMMFKEMRATVPKSDLLPQDFGEDTFNSMLDEKLMDKASESGGLGLADVLYKQLSKQLKAAYKP